MKSPFKVKPNQAPAVSKATEEITKIEVEIQRQVAIKASYSVMISQAEAEIQQLVYAHRRLQAEAAGVRIGEVEAAKEEIDKALDPATGGVAQ